MKNKIFIMVVIGVVFLPFLAVSNAYAANAMTADTYSFTIVPDTTAPTAVSNLSITDSTENTVTLGWTATGDDGASGTASAYDVRYSTSVINAANWASATQATGEPVPSASGNSQSMTISGLSRETTYYFAIKVSDEVANESSLSNVANTTTPDETAPSVVSDLSISGKDHESVTLIWTAPGDNGSAGTAASYDIRYSTSNINIFNLNSATQVSGDPMPSVAGSSETITISGLNADTTYYFAIRTTDDASNRSGLSNVPSDTTEQTPDTTPPYTEGHVPTKDSTGVSTDANIVVHIKDDGAGVDIDTIQMLVNGINVSPTITGTPADYTLTYDPTSDFINGQTVFVTINASDLAP
jgi:hypothetical protein